MVNVTFGFHDGTEQKIDAEVGWKLMECAVNESVPGIYGDCGGEAQCATCHVYVRPEWQQATGERTPAEEAMLKATHGVTEQSRLCCQIVVSDEIDGLVVDVVDD